MAKPKKKASKTIATQKPQGKQGESSGSRVKQVAGQKQTAHHENSESEDNEWQQSSWRLRKYVRNMPNTDEVQERESSELEVINLEDSKDAAEKDKVYDLSYLKNDSDSPYPKKHVGD